MKISIALAATFVVLAPIAVSAHTQEEQEACMNDAFQFCGDAIPDRGRVAACLAAKKAQISVACRTVMARYAPPDATAMNVPPAPHPKATPAPRAKATSASSHTPKAIPVAHKSGKPLTLNPKAYR
jgi:hypothetical protein